MNFRLKIKDIIKPSVIEGVRHFSTREDAMIYIALKYGVIMKYHRGVPGQVRAYYEGKKYSKKPEESIMAWTPAGEWSDDHDIIKIMPLPWDDSLIEFVTYGDAYCYEYMHNKEYNFIETV